MLLLLVCPFSIFHAMIKFHFLNRKTFPSWISLHECSGHTVLISLAKSPDLTGHDFIQRTALQSFSPPLSSVYTRWGTLPAAWNLLSDRKTVTNKGIYDAEADGECKGCLQRELLILTMCGEVTREMIPADIP